MTGFTTRRADAAPLAKAHNRPRRSSSLSTAHALENSTSHRKVYLPVSPLQRNAGPFPDLLKFRFFSRSIQSEWNWHRGNECVETTPQRIGWNRTMQFQINWILRAAFAPWRWFALRRRRLALLLIPFGLAATRADASDESVVWTPVALKQADRTRNDLDLSLRARRLLVEDPALARYDIIVRIDDRVAELSGSVPSMEIAMRAESSLRTMLGLASIRNRLTIEDKAGSAKELNEQSRVDWRIPEQAAPFSQTPLVNTAFGAGLRETSTDSSFSWRPVRPAGKIVSYPIPFMPEGLSRPAQSRDAIRESTSGNREYLRIGRVDVITSPAENRKEADDFVLPAIDLRNLDSKPVPPAASTVDPSRLRYFFLGL